jgi:hypothetical protein
VIPLLAQAGTDLPLYLETANYRDFTDRAPDQHKILQLRDDIRAGCVRTTLPERFRNTYVTAPPLPRNYINRDTLLTALREAVVLDEPGPSIAITAIRGMGGIGKTILAQALAYDEVIQEAFPDGIAWTTIGKDASHNLKERLQEVCRALGIIPPPMRVNFNASIAIER